MFRKLFNESQRRIVEYLVSEGERSLTEITQHIGLSKPSVSGHLNELVGHGVVKRREERTSSGRAALYSPNRFAFVMIFNPEGKSLVSIETQSGFSPQFLLLEQLTEGEFKEDLRTLLEAVDRLEEGGRPIAIILFGSVVEGKGTWKSDIDVAVLGLTWDQKSKTRIGRLVSDVNMATKHQIKPHFLKKLEFETGDSLLVEEIKSSGMVIYGDIFGRTVPWREMRRYKSTMMQA
jgi:predicted nucleotidyltransferase